MSIYFTDQVQITPISRDINFRTETEGTPFLSKAYVEDESKIQFGSDGQPFNPIKFIGLPRNTLIVKGDFVEITKLHGKVIAQSQTTIDTSRNLIGLWRCDERKGLVALDESQYKNHGILEGTAPGWATGKSNGCINLPGTDERIDCGNLSPLDQIGNGSFWLSFWMKGAVPLASGLLFSKYQDVSNSLGLMSYGANNRLYVHLEKDDITVADVFSIATAPFDTIWNHIIFAVNRITDKALLYMNTVKDATEIDISSLPADCSNIANLSWGGYHFGGNYYVGAFDELRLYTGIPIQNDIDVLHDNPGAPIRFVTAEARKKRKVKKVIEVGSFGMSHIEVYI